MCTSQQHQKDLKLIVTTLMDKRVQVLLLSRHDLEKSREQ